MSLDFGPDFKAFNERLAGERERRLKNAEQSLVFGVRFLDLALAGIFQNDLILIGARTGAGKTELSTIIATHNAARGKRVHYIALEAEPDEIERRSKYKLLSDMVWKFDRIQAQRMNYLDWYAGRLEDLVGRHEESVNKVLSERYGTLKTYYRERTFDSAALEKLILSVQDQTDLIILDHLHYVDSDDPSENRGYKTIVKKIRDVALGIGKPIVVVAHIRKGERRGAPIVPGVEDYHGSSDIPKIATKAIMLAPAFDRPTGDLNLWSTYIAVAKCRPDGSRTRYVGAVSFNASTGRYENDFVVGRLRNGDQEFEEVLGKDWPRWAMQVPDETRSNS